MYYFYFNATAKCVINMEWKHKNELFSVAINIIIMVVERFMADDLRDTTHNSFQLNIFKQKLLN